MKAFFERLRAFLDAELAGASRGCPGHRPERYAGVARSEKSCQAGGDADLATEEAADEDITSGNLTPEDATPDWRTSSAPGIEVGARSSGGSSATASSTVCNPVCRTETVTSPPSGGR